MGDLISKIQNIGARLVECEQECDGILRDRDRGILPRCLFLEDKDRENSTGAAIVGINPGWAGKREEKFYKDHGCTYDSICKFWEESDEFKKINYYRYLRDLVSCLGFRGSILWTELVKCQNKIKNRLPPPQTFRNCTRIYLNKELKEIDNSWPLIAVGREAYKALAYLYPDRSLIGVPHPNSRGQFHSLFNKGSKRQMLSKKSGWALSGVGPKWNIADGVVPEA